MKKQTKKNSVVTNVLFCGTGGQGVLSAAEICGWAALIEGYHVKKSEVHGMAQRGGSVESHLRFGARVLSPLIPLGEADFLVSFHHGEHMRMKEFLRPKGRDLIAALDEAQRTLKDMRFVNIYLLGVLSRYVPIAHASWIAAIETVLSGKRTEENKSIFLQGRGGGV